MVDKHTIRELLSKSTGRDIKVGDDDSLLVAGLIDSLTMVQLLTSIEECYKLKISEDELQPENFETINAIVNLLTKRGV